ncbi:ATP-binding cassette domain-containing protein (plasmid) [Klebsiella pneumoniae]|nr:ATP-binding cassette domain-containing protein [Klebsiella pneumoniae]
MITFQNVTKHYDNGSVVVDGLSLVAPGGKITVFVGPSGCGKTTSLRMINRLVEPSSGRILLNGEATEQMDIVQLRRRIGYVIQNAGLFPHKNIIDNIATTAILNGAAKSKARARAGELLEVVGLDPQIAKRFPWQLSGGQQQRVGVARALAADPEFMLMDEPFSAVDPVVREQLQEEFLRIQKEVSKTIIMVTHDIDEAMKLGDLVAVLKPGGKLAQMASPGELLNTPQNAFVADFIGKDRGYRKLSFHYSFALLVRTVCDGLDSVSADTRQSAAALGYKPAQQFFQIDLPLAVPVIGSGLRVAVVSNVSIVSVAALIGAPQLGSLFTLGFQLQFLTPVIAGIALSIILALLLDMLVVYVTRQLSRWQPQRG